MKKLLLLITSSVIASSSLYSKDFKPEEVIATYKGGNITLGDVADYYDIISGNYGVPFKDLPEKTREEAGFAYAKNRVSSEAVKELTKAKPLSEKAQKRAEYTKDMVLVESYVEQKTEERFEPKLVEQGYENFKNNAYSITYVPFPSSEAAKKAYKELVQKKKEEQATKFKNHYTKFFKDKPNKNLVKNDKTGKNEMISFVVSEVYGNITPELESKLKEAKQNEQEYVIIDLKNAYGNMHGLVKLNLNWNPDKDLDEKTVQNIKSALEKQIKDKLYTEAKKELLDNSNLSFVVKTESSSDKKDEKSNDKTKGLTNETPSDSTKDSGAGEAKKN